MTGGQASKQRQEPQIQAQADESEAASGSSHPTSVWVFGYGSLLWKTNFPYENMVVGYVKGYARRFWQGSTDHRGVPGAPGRVVTLVQTKEECTWGIAFKVQPKDVPEVIAYLDHREKGGYTTHKVTFHPQSLESTSFTALVYIGMDVNPSYLGPAPNDHIAKQIVSTRGPSGCNIQYVLELAESMRKIAPLVTDDHLFEVESLVRGLMQVTPRGQMRVAFAAGLPDCKCYECIDRTSSSSECSTQELVVSSNQ